MKKLERVILEQIEKMSRKNAQSSNEAYPVGLNVRLSYISLKDQESKNSKIW